MAHFVSVFSVLAAIFNVKLLPAFIVNVHCAVIVDVTMFVWHSAETVSGLLACFSLAFLTIETWKILRNKIRF